MKRNYLRQQFVFSDFTMMILILNIILAFELLQKRVIGNTLTPFFLKENLDEHSDCFLYDID